MGVEEKDTGSPAAGDEGAGSPGKLGRGLAALVVDDDPLILKFLVHLLAEEGFIVEGAGSFRQAAQLAESRRFDLALLDIILPDGDGMTLAQMLAAQADCQVAVMTGYASLESAIEAMRVRVADYLMKPLRASAILDRLTHMVEHLHLKRQREKLLRDLKQQTETISSLEAQATRDSLTGLFNHSYFQDQLAQEVARCLRYQHDLSLLFIDIDRFKEINDTLGHPAGDTVLKSVADILRGSFRDADLRFRLREHDLAARYGGDEFVLMLPETPKAGAAVTAERLRRAVESCSFMLDPPLPVTLSLGLATLPQDAPDREGLVAAADMALYVAKNGGRNRVMAYSSGLSRQGQDGPVGAVDVRRMESIFHLLDSPEALLDFAGQPIVDAKSQQLYGLELLCRPRHELFENPQELLRTAELVGRVNDLGRRLRQQVVGALQRLPSERVVFVNLHPQEMNDPQLLSGDMPLRHFAARVVFEVNRSREIRDQARLRRVLDALREAGFRILLDDLCEGYLGLASMVNIKPDFIKTGVTFLERGRAPGRASRLLKHLFDAAAGEGIQVITTGIENEQQKQLALYFGCQLLQGFLLGRPEQIKPAIGSG